MQNGRESLGDNLPQYRWITNQEHLAAATTMLGQVYTFLVHTHRTVKKENIYWASECENLARALNKSCQINWNICNSFIAIRKLLARAYTHNNKTLIFFQVGRGHNGIKFYKIISGDVRLLIGTANITKWFGLEIC